MTSKSKTKRECGPTHSHACQCREEYFAKLEAKLKIAEEALEKCHEELVGALMHEGGDLKTALERADAALAELRKA